MHKLNSPRDHHRDPRPQSHQSHPQRYGNGSRTPNTFARIITMVSLVIPASLKFLPNLYMDVLEPKAVNLRCIMTINKCLYGVNRAENRATAEERWQETGEKPSYLPKNQEFASLRAWQQLIHQSEMFTLGGKVVSSKSDNGGITGYGQYSIINGHSACLAGVI